MEGVRAGLRHRVHYRTRKLPILGTEAVRDQSKLGNRVGIRDHAGAHILRLVHLGAVHQKCIRPLRLPVSGDVASRTIQAGGWRTIVIVAVCIRRSHAGLKRQQIQIRSPVQWHRENLVRLDRRSHRCALSLNLQSVRLNRDCLTYVSDRKNKIERQRVIHIEIDIVKNSSVENRWTESKSHDNGREEGQECS